MRYGSIRIAVIIVMLSSLLWVPRAFSEPYVGGYLGFASTADSDMKNADFILFRGDRLIGTVDDDFPADIDTSFAFGARAGYWFDFLPLLGTQFDFYVFYPDVTIPRSGFPVSIQDDPVFKFDVTVVALGFSILGRYPFLKSPEFPRGRLQPYLGLGPAIFITSWDDQESVENANIGSETVVNGGLQFMVGTSFFVREAISVFAEYLNVV